MSDVIKKAIFGYAELGKKEDSLGVKAIEQYNQLLETADRRLALLRRVECVWSDWTACPICRQMQTEGHAPNCELAEEIK